MKTTKFIKSETKTLRQSSGQAGFTLIEMLVSVALFSIVVVIAMGAILTVLDSNRKAQTVNSVMNNLNFAMESITRHVKTGVDPVIIGSGANAKLTVDGIVLSGGDFTRQKVSFKFIETDGLGSVGRCIGTSCSNDASFVAITAPEVDVDNFLIKQSGYEDAGDQPRTFIFIEGKVVFNNSIQSTFRTQTTISQRRLDIAGEESNI